MSGAREPLSRATDQYITPAASRRYSDHTQRPGLSANPRVFYYCGFSAYGDVDVVVVGGVGRLIVPRRRIASHATDPSFHLIPALPGLRRDRRPLYSAVVITGV